MKFFKSFDSYKISESIQFGLSNFENIEKVNNLLLTSEFPKVYSELLKNEGITLDLVIWDDDKTIEIDIIEVPKNIAKSGIGSSIMKTLCLYSDLNNKNLTLKPAGGSRISRTKLIEWYSKFGFVINKGDNEIDNLLFMYRLPKKVNAITLQD